MIYLDTASSTPLLPEVNLKLQSVLPYYANPSSLHAMGQQSQKLIDEAKASISVRINSEPSELYFTSGATMSNNQAIQGFLKKHYLSYPHVVTSCIEHDDIYLMLQSYPRNLKHFIPCDIETGLLDIECLKECLDELDEAEETVLVSIQWANNEMGVIQDMEKITSLVNSYSDVWLHTDATQYVPYYPVDVKKLGIDMLSCSSQKIGGLKGTGLLYVRDGVHLTPLVYGDQGLIGGTENVPGIACMGEAFRYLDYSDDRISSLKEKRDYLYSALAEVGQLIGSLDNRLPNNLNMIFDGIRGEELQALLSECGIYVSTGSACSSHSDKPSRTLSAMAYKKEQIESSIRFSIGDNISLQELKEVAKKVKFCVDILRQK